MSRLFAFVSCVALAASVAAGPVAAQAPAGPPGGGQRFIDRFNAANTSHDGRLTLQQAEAAHMQWVARHFAEIDAQRKGYVTIDDLRAYRQHMRAGRTAVN